MINKPLLFSFRRCPYAIRARMALYYADIDFDILEVDLKNKPKELFDYSPKGTVPVLVLTDNKVIDESIDIIRYALSVNDLENWLSKELEKEITKLINENDKDFAPQLTKYKYFVRYPEKEQTEYKKEAEYFIQKLENRLNNSKFLLKDTPTIADVAIFTLVRQFSMVEPDWWKNCQYIKLKSWLNYFLSTQYYKKSISKK